MTPVERSQYIGLLREGVSKSRAASMLNLTNRGISTEMSKNQRFAEDVEQVLAVRNDDVEAALFETAMKGNVEAQKFWLTNRDEESWANRSRVEHTGKNGGPIAIATQATLALRNVLLEGDTRERAIEYIDVELAPMPEAAGELER